MFFNCRLGQAHDLRNVLHGFSVTNPFKRFPLPFGQGPVRVEVGKGDDLEVGDVIHHDDFTAMTFPRGINLFLGHATARRQRNRAACACDEIDLKLTVYPDVTSRRWFSLKTKPSLSVNPPISALSRIQPQLQAPVFSSAYLTIGA
jgi:hypothetical protein